MDSALYAYMQVHNVLCMHTVAGVCAHSESDSPNSQGNDACTCTWHTFLHARTHTYMQVMLTQDVAVL